MKKINNNCEVVDLKDIHSIPSMHPIFKIKSETLTKKINDKYNHKNDIKVDNYVSFEKNNNGKYKIFYSDRFEPFDGDNVIKNVDIENEDLKNEEVIFIGYQALLLE